MICSRIRAKKCSGRFLASQQKGANEVNLTSDELIDILKKRDWSQLWFYEQCNGKLGANTRIDVNEKADDVEFSIHTPENMMDETVDRVIDLLEHLEECIQRAYVWLSNQNLCDEWLTKPYYSPQALEQLFRMGTLECNEEGIVPDSPQTDVSDFVMTFFMDHSKLPHNDFYPWLYDVYFHYDDLQPYKSKKYLY